MKLAVGYMHGYGLIGPGRRRARARLATPDKELNLLFVKNIRVIFFDYWSGVLDFTLAFYSNCFLLAAGITPSTNRLEMNEFLDLDGIKYFFRQHAQSDFLDLT